MAVNKIVKNSPFLAESIKECPEYTCQMVARALEKNKAGLGQVPKAAELGRLLFYTKQSEKASLIK